MINLIRKILRVIILAFLAGYFIHGSILFWQNYTDQWCTPVKEVPDLYMNAFSMGAFLIATFFWMIFLGLGLPIICLILLSEGIKWIFKNDKAKR